MRLQDVHNVYFLGIGGIGMSAIARLFQSQGKSVHGYDKTPTLLTSQLEREGMYIHYQDDISRIPSDLDLVVYTPAIPDDLKEWVYIKKSGVPVLKRSQVLGLLSKDLFTIAIAGTHGKTSITSILSHILKQGNRSFYGFVGGILRNYDSNLIMSGNGETIVIEADEYDRSFHALKPDIALISSIDPDHLDIYGTYEQLRHDYILFADGIKKGGILFLNNTISWPQSAYRTIRYGGDSEYSIESYSTDRQGSTVQFRLGTQITNPFRFHIPGRHNVENALAAASIAFNIGLSLHEITSALVSFSGVVRRFDVRFTSERFVYVDDYAHHPKELESAINAAREYYPGLNVVGIFQPHLYSRTRDLAEGFAKSLDLLDKAYLLEIYPAREIPIEGVDPELISGQMEKPCPVISREEVFQIAGELDNAILITLGAGDIDLLVSPLERLFEERITKMGRKQQ